MRIASRLSILAGNMKKSMCQFQTLTHGFYMVREAGLEPAWTFSGPQEPESCASANFATLADVFIFYHTDTEVSIEQSVNMRAII